MHRGQVLAVLVLRDTVTRQRRLSADTGRVLSDGDVWEQPGEEEEEEVTQAPSHLFSFFNFAEGFPKALL